MTNPRKNPGNIFVVCVNCYLVRRKRRARVM